jgi:hypothetical protein
VIVDGNLIKGLGDYQTHEMWAACIDMELPVGFEITDNTCYKAAEYSICSPIVATATPTDHQVITGTLST